MNIIQKFNPNVGDEVTTNIDGRRIRHDTFTGIIGRIDYEDECIYVLNNEIEGSWYDGWREDAKKYGKLYSWQVNFEVDDNGIFEIRKLSDRFINFLLKNK